MSDTNTNVVVPTIESITTNPEASKPPTITTKRKSVTKVEKLEALIAKKHKQEDDIKRAQENLQKINETIKAMQREIGGLEFLSLSPEAILQISKSFESQNTSVINIIEFLRDGDFDKLREIHNSINLQNPNNTDNSLRGN